MWIALNDGFISIVEPRPFDVPQGARHPKGWQHRLLMVRARKAEHLSRHFPDHHIYRWKGRDYPFRVFVDRAELGEIVMRLVTGISYPNFKNSVRDDELHDAYSAIWSVMHRYQNGAYRPRRSHVQGRFFDEGFRLDRGGRWDGELPPIVGKVIRGPGLDFVPCNAAGCTVDQPCLTCMADALGDGDDDLYGQFDTGDDRDGDEGAEAHRRVPPRG